jgi:hypothetical protein
MAISALQRSAEGSRRSLVLRHPMFPGSISAPVRDAAQELILAVCNVAPVAEQTALHALLQAGFDPAEDVAYRSSGRGGFDGGLGPGPGMETTEDVH